MASRRSDVIRPTVSSVAGYQCFVDVPSDWDDLVSVLRSSARSRAKALSLRLEFQRRGAPSGHGPACTRWSIGVDGNGYRIAAWVRQLEREWPIVAEGYVSQPTRDAQRVATSLLARWVDQLIGDGAATTTVPIVDPRVDDPVSWLWPVFDFPEGLVITPRLALADEVFAQHITGSIGPELVVEEVHTALEAILRHVTNADRDRWTRLLAKATDQGLLTAPERDVVKRFNDRIRVGLKHDALTVPKDEQSELLATVAEVVQIAELVVERADRMWKTN